ncbi:MAG: FMN-binding negative transcriptional regulator [Oceanihabitans sp.]
MKYPPNYHQENNKLRLLEVIKNYPLATVISVSKNQPFVTHLPLIYRAEGTKLIGHIDIYNPHAKLLQENNEVYVVFSGPQCYISPSIYTTKQLPTWNYINVHLKGKVIALNSNEALKESLIEMTSFLEAPTHKYILEPSNPKMEAAINYIKMFEITIESWEGKFKLSQDKNTQDMANAKAELIRANKKSIQDFLNKIL